MPTCCRFTSRRAAIQWTWVSTSRISFTKDVGLMLLTFPMNLLTATREIFEAVEVDGTPQDNRGVVLKFDRVDQLATIVHIYPVIGDRVPGEVIHQNLVGGVLLAVVAVPCVVRIHLPCVLPKPRLGCGPVWRRLRWGRKDACERRMLPLMAQGSDAS